MIVKRAASKRVKQAVSKPVKRAQHPAPALVQHMRVDHGGRDVGVAAQSLHRADIVAALQQVRGEGGASMYAA